MQKINTALSPRKQTVREFKSRWCCCCFSNKGGGRAKKTAKKGGSTKVRPIVGNEALNLSGPREGTWFISTPTRKVALLRVEHESMEQFNSPPRRYKTANNRNKREDPDELKIIKLEEQKNQLIDLPGVPSAPESKPKPSNKIFKLKSMKSKQYSSN